MPRTDTLALPHCWPTRIKAAILQAISLAHVAITHARGWAANAVNPRARQAGEIERLTAEVALLKEQMVVKDARLARIPPHRRPHYTPTERMRILELKAARGWSLKQTANAFLVEPDTIASWLKRLDEPGPKALVQMGEPVNKFPDFVRHIVCRLKTLCPSLGKVKIAQLLARAGLHLGVTTVWRMLKQQPAPSPSNADDASTPIQDAEAKPASVVTAKYPNHVWHVDLTLVPIVTGFWTPWLPFALPQCWPFCWWVAAVVDHFSRRVMAVAVWKTPPTSIQIRAFLGRAVRRVSTPPKYIICDKGTQFWCDGFKDWCRRKGIRSRFGAIGQHGSIAIVERFIRTMKDECTRKILVPFRLARMRVELTSFLDWFNRHRPHTALDGRTPDERYRRIPAACRRPRFEPRAGWPAESSCAAPKAKVRGKPGQRLELVVSFHEGRKHLPVVALKRVA